MNNKVVLIVLLVVCSSFAQGNTTNSFYISNRSPLIKAPFVELPLGSIKPEGWLLTMLEIQRDGLTGNLDSVYASVCGPRNGWLGGDGDGWERGPYWLDGLVPLAYMLDDPALKAKAQKWIEWSINNQQKDGYFGPVPFSEKPEHETGIQKDKRRDWWPKMVMLKVLKQYYLATGDERVLALMDNYFRYMLENLPKTPLGHWTFWGERRGADNLAIVHWLYNITGESYLLELGELIHEQTHKWEDLLGDGAFACNNPPIDRHCVNIAQGMKAPAVWYQQNRKSELLDDLKQGMLDLQQSFGYVNGMYGADEALHSNDPVQGVEFCSVVELMYSLETILPISGDVFYADYLEKLAFNALPAQHTDDFRYRQYFQQANQVQVTDQRHNFYNDDDARQCFGVLTGYPCCTCNMHQGWPKFVQNLFYATPENGVAALIYGPANARLKVGNGVDLELTEKTTYPFDDKIIFDMQLSARAEFGFHLRIPAWCDSAVISINGKVFRSPKANRIVEINRKWTDGDVVELQLPMRLTTSRWYERTVGIERGPLVYALRIEEEWRKVDKSHLERYLYEHPFWEVYPTSPWNYGILESSVKNMEFNIIKSDELAEMPWNLENAPVTLYTKGMRIPEWVMYNHSAGTPPRSPYRTVEKQPIVELQLVPYGCTTLRISQFSTCR